MKKDESVKAPEAKAPEAPAQADTPKVPEPVKAPEAKKVIAPDAMTILTMKFNALCKLQGISFKEDAGRFIAVR